VLVLGNEGGGGLIISRPSYTRLMDWFKEANHSNIEYSTNIQSRL
jgi:hypothetical protein